MDRRDKLAAIFENTRDFYEKDNKLSVYVRKSRERTKLYEASEYPSIPDVKKKQECRITVTNSRTFEAAMKHAAENPDKKIAVLNFASATRPGGGVTTGASAQEECLCRCSTLYPTLDQQWLWRKYYQKNRDAHDVKHTDACIYSPAVVICKTDTDFPERMDEKDWVKVDVISCAAPNLRREPANWHNPETGKPIRMDPKELYDLHLRRAKHILHVAAANKVDILVLGPLAAEPFQMTRTSLRRQ